MATYQNQGAVAPKRHTQFRKADGSLYHEEVLGSHGFSGVYSTLYHLHPPTAVSRFARAESPALQPWDPPAYRQHHLRTGAISEGGDPIQGRQPQLFNQDIVISVTRPTESMRALYRNADADELYFVHEGSGRLHTALGTLEFGPGDYLVIPRGITYRMMVDGACRLLVVESHGPIEIPARYRNEYGQLLEHAPYSQRDIRVPKLEEPRDEEGEFEVLVKVPDGLMAYHYVRHPFDVAGWDGYLYPWALNAADFEPVTGRVHQPPPAHQTFQGPSFVVCSFVPRKLDYHPQAVPSPYAHSNVDCDEVLYYVSGTFTSRRGIEEGSITLHRHGLPHGPQPGALEASLGAEATDEMAVMIDTFHPLRLASLAQRYDDPGYPLSWVARQAP